MGNKMLKLASFVLLVTMVSLTLVSGTYAKYTSSISGTDTVQVAKWDIKAGKSGEETSITGGGTVSFDLFNTINDTGNAAAETDVTTGKIAPGTEGSFSFNIKNDSEVTAIYGLTYELTNAGNVPLEFSIDDGHTWVASLTGLNNAVSDANKIAIGYSKLVTVRWRWAFTGAASSNYTETQTELSDTTIGIAAPSVTVSATLTVEQFD